MGGRTARTAEISNGTQPLVSSGERHMADRTWSAYATPSQRDTSLVIDNEGGRPIGGGLAG